jgi:hypothetical protein
MTDSRDFDEPREAIARALYEHWVAEDFGNDYCDWARLPDKQTWLERADAVLAVPAIRDVLKMKVVGPLDAT